MTTPALIPGTPLVWRDRATLQVGFRLAVSDAPRGAPAALRLLDGRRPLREVAREAGVAHSWLLDVVDRLAAAGVLLEPPRRAEVAVLGGAGWRAQVAAALPASAAVVDEVTEHTRVAVWLGSWLGAEPALPAGVGRVAHILVGPVPGGVGVGPFVVPGEGCCHLCCALTLAGRDRAWPRIAAQLASTRPVLDPAALVWAAGLAAAHVTAYLAGRRPQSVGASFELAHGDLSVRQWPRHPDCPCAVAAA